MGPAERWSFHAAALATAGSGLANGLLRWFGERVGPFGPEAHPWLPFVQRAHVLAAPFLLFALGAAVRGHLRVRLKKGSEGRRTGLSAAFLIAPMALSGYAAQVAVDPGWRTGLGWAHGASAGLFLLAYLGHLAGHLRRARGN
ncbi:hypothetical protein [Geothrix sp. 21YS21S-4]|uniref:hypothetical protein n=1 Tax=Geothrix sp. 21YS21S-4 TaxID=3068889 RepID=UPI0027BB10F3|nr:hypothetical protein [Geothrix sp. 21YS21S-4]